MIIRCVHAKAFLTTLSIVLFSQQFIGLYGANTSDAYPYDFGCMDLDYDTSSSNEGLEKDFMDLLGCKDTTSEPVQTKSNWLQLCNDLQVNLVSSCYALVNPDNSLTLEGEGVLGCIRDYVMLSGGPLPRDLDVLENLEEPADCKSTVNWGLVGNITNLRDILNARFD